jgi:hypothetical protein
MEGKTKTEKRGTESNDHEKMDGSADNSGAALRLHRTRGGEKVNV